MRSPVFEAMFYEKLAEEGCTIYIEDIEPETMKSLLRFVYSDNPELNGENVLRCLYAAKKYALSGLVKRCSSFLENNIDTSNVSSIHEQAVFYEMRALQAKCCSYILENASEVFSSQNFLELSHTSLLSLLKEDELNMNEMDIFSAVLEWSKHNCKSKGQSEDAMNLRECLGEALFEIRFPIMPIEGFARVIAPAGILTNEEQIMLYEFNATKGSSKLSKFKSKERTTKDVTIDVLKYIQNQGRACSYGNVFQIQYQHNKSFNPEYQRQMYNIPFLKVKSFTGSFVKNVTGITHEDTPILNYKIAGNKITFKIPVELSNWDTLKFYQRGKIHAKALRKEKYLYKVESYPDMTNDEDMEDPDYTSSARNMQQNANKQTFCIVQVPFGTETIIFG